MTAHGHAEVSGGERGCVVDSVADNHDGSAVGFECSADVDLFVGFVPGRFAEFAID